MNQGQPLQGGEQPKSFETGSQPKTLRPNYFVGLLLLCGCVLVGALTFRSHHERRVFLAEHPAPEVALAKDGSVLPTVPLAVMYSIVWEGQDLRPANLAAIQRIRAELPQVQFYHFLSPSYFLRPNVNVPELLKNMRSVIRAEDMVGLHINGWRSLVERSGVEFKFKPNFWGSNISEEMCLPDCGNDVPLQDYSSAELERIFKTALGTLDDAGFSNINAMVVGGWLASDSILEAAAKSGIRFSFSQVWPSLLEPSLKNYPLFTRLAHQWPGWDDRTVGVATTIQTKYGQIAELGNSATAVDFIDSNHSTALLNRMIDTKRKSPGLPILFHLGMHQETAAKYATRFVESVNRVNQELQRTNITVDLSPRGSLYGLVKFAQMSH